jgi:hypothetical protein
LGGAFIYSQVTADRDHDERVALAWRVATYSAGVMLVALWAGATIMSFFGVSLSALRIAGGACGRRASLGDAVRARGSKTEDVVPNSGKLSKYFVALLHVNEPSTAMFNHAEMARLPESVDRALASGEIARGILEPHDKRGIRVEIHCDDLLVRSQR